MKKTNLLLSFLIIFSISQSFAQKSSETFIDFGEEKVTKSEFKRVYKKNNSGEMVSKSSVEEYLDLYINFKLKVMEAEARGLDTVTSFVTELKGYRKQLAQPYLSAEGVIEELKKEAYERLQEEIKASHILIASKPNDSPEDTLKAYKKALEVKKKLEKGEDFEKMALAYSDDPSVENNKGDLGYFTAFYMVYPFETAAYETEENEISEIAKTRFGYHILKVADRRPASGNMTVAHILISSDPEIAKTNDPEAKIHEIYQSITEEEEEFESMARQFSDDNRSARQGGRLPSFGVGRMVPEFEQVAFSLEKDGQISQPFQTQYGWHIIKRIQKDEIGTYEEVEDELNQRVQKDSRANLTEGAILKKIKSQYGFSEKLKERNDFYDLIDSSYFQAKWNSETAKKYSKTIFTIGDTKVNQHHFYSYLKSTQKKSEPIDIRVLVNNKYSEFKRNKLLDYKDSKLEEEQPEFKALMEEYHDGILLFNLTDKLVWSKAVEDTSGLEEFYEKNKEQYKWSKRVDAVLYSAKNKEIYNLVKKLIEDGVGEDSIQKIVNKSSQLNIKFELKKFERGDNSVVDGVEWKEGLTDFVEKNDRLQFVHIKKVLEPTYKTLDDARGTITSDYQEYLEKEWIKNLREKYDYSIDQEVLKELKSELD